MLDTTTSARFDATQQVTGHACDLAPTPSGCRQGTWHVVASYPKAERRAHAALHLKGYEPYLPLLTVRRSDRSYHTSALFPGYLFVRLDLSKPWYPIRYAPGVYGLILTDGIPSICPEAAVEALRAAEHLRATPLPASSDWAPGMACSLGKPQVMAGLPAVVLAVHRDQATVAIMMLGHLRNVSVNLDCLKARDDG